MSYDEIDIEDMEWKEDLQAFTYQCPCGDLFQITMVRLRILTQLFTASIHRNSSALHWSSIETSTSSSRVVQEELAAGEEIAHCPSCSLYITVIYDPVSVLTLSGQYVVPWAFVRPQHLCISFNKSVGTWAFVDLSTFA